MSLELEVLDFLRDVDEDFHPSLSSKFKIEEYAHKLSLNAAIFSIYEGKKIIAMIAVYCNDPNKVRAYIPLVAIRKPFRRLGFGSQLLKLVIRYLSAQQFELLGLEVYKNNNGAIDFYKEFGFSIVGNNEHSLFLELSMQKIGVYVALKKKYF